MTDHTNPAPLKVFQVSDMEWYAAESAEQAAMLFHRDTGCECDPDDIYPRELSDAELDEEQPEFDENEAPTGGTTCVRKMLAEHGTEPGSLCGAM